MLCKYKIVIRAICPVHGVDDEYDVTVTSAETIYVEKLIAFAKSLETVKKTQEDLTRMIAKKFGCRVKSVGYHSNIKAVVRCG